MSPQKKKVGSQSIREPEFGRRVKAVRRHLKLKQKEMAEKLNLSMTTLSDIETGRSYPGYDFFYNMVEHFNVNLYYLLFGRGEMLGLPVGGVPFKDEVKRRGKEGDEIILRVERGDIREFLDYFFRSRVVQYYVMGEFYKYLNKERKSIEADIEAIALDKDRKKT